MARSQRLRVLYGDRSNTVVFIHVEEDFRVKVRGGGSGGRLEDFGSDIGRK